MITDAPWHSYLCSCHEGQWRETGQMLVPAEWNRDNDLASLCPASTYWTELNKLVYSSTREALIHSNNL